MYSLYGFGGFGRRRGWGKAKKSQKKKKEHWFERLTVDQNKQLCKAIKVRHVGNKKDLMDRLLENDQSSKYACEKYGINVDRLKAMCRERNLQVSGVKFDLVLRILHCDNSTTPEGSTLKRAATDVITTVDVATGTVVEKHVPKKRKKAKPSASKVYTRVDKKIESCKQKKYQSHWGSKSHSSEVYGLVADILSSDVINSEESYLSKDPRFAVSIAEAACTSLSENFHKMMRPGYDDYGSWGEIDSSLRTIAEAVKPVFSAGEKEKMAAWIEDLYNTIEPYGLDMNAPDLLETAEYLRGNEDAPKKSEETAAVAKEEVPVDDRKPAAAKEVPVDDRKPAAAAVAAASVPEKADVSNDNNSEVEKPVIVNENVANAGIM